MPPYKVIDTITGEFIGSDISLEGQNNAIPMAVMDNEWLFVADSRSKAVHIIDTKTDQILFDIPIKLSDEKRIVAMTVFNNTLFIASENIIWAMRLSPVLFNYYGKK